MALTVAAAASPLAAQQLPAQPNAVRQQLSQSAAPAQARPAAPPVANPAGAPQTQPVAARPAARRDPFDPLVNRNTGPVIPANLPPGKAGLMIATLNLDGIVRGPNGMIAIVSNPQMRVYFLRQGDQLYDGQVGTITMEAVSFHQTGRDPFGAVIERDITRRLYPSPGEQP
jgi:type IV pilus assembly protein PilP